MSLKDNNKHFQNLVNFSSAMFYGSIAHYRSLGLQYAEVPAIVGITGACENVDTLFKIGNRLNLPLFFTQTGQLALEQVLQYAHGVYTIIFSGRDEETEDKRHLRQFRLTEEEFDCTMAKMTKDTYDEEKMFETLLAHIELATKAMINSVLENNSKILKSDYKRDPALLKEIMARPYLRISYEEAVLLLQKNGWPELQFGDDLISEHEAKIVELLNKKTRGYGKNTAEFSPVFIMKYPKEIKFFNMKVSTKDPRVVLSADCIFPFSGEGVGSAVREHDGVKLIVRFLTSKMYKMHEQRGGKYEDFQWYTEDIIVAQKTLPHAGYGIGNERVMQFILGMDDIRQCSLFCLMNRQTKDWDVAKRGMQPILDHKKTILLSIGKDENKAKLLPSLKKLRSNSHILYATQNTNLFLQKHGIPSTRVYKISENGQPNLRDLLQKNMFDLIINIPTNPKRDDKEISDGKLIRQAAIESGTTLVTDVDIAASLLSNLGKKFQ